MRKADYSHLAAALQDERTRVMNAWFEDETERLRHLDTLRRVAQRFAARASVNAAEFLKACGMT